MASGRFDDLPLDANGQALRNDRLWELKFSNDRATGWSNRLFSTAGVGDELNRLFGFLTPTDNSALDSRFVLD